MEEQLISFETAKLAKQVGFNPNDGEYIETRWFYSGESIEAGEPFLFDRLDYRYNEVRSTSFHYDVLVSTQSFLQKWLRDVHDIDFVISPRYYGKDIRDLKNKKYEIIFPSDVLNNISALQRNLLFRDTSEISKTYEDALEIGLQVVLKIFIDKKN